MFLKRFSIPIHFLIIEDDGLHLVIESKINDIACRMLIDTGASRTVFDRNKIFNFIGQSELEDHEKLSTGLGTDSMPTSSTMLNEFRIGNLIVNNFQAILLDLGHVNTSYSKMGFEQIDGVLGSDILFKHDAVIDYKKKKLILSIK